VNAEVEVARCDAEAQLVEPCRVERQSEIVWREVSESRGNPTGGSDTNEMESRRFEAIEVISWAFSCGDHVKIWSEPLTGWRVDRES